MLVSRRSLVHASLGLLVGMGLGGSGPRKPKPPPGRDPGGFAVALIGDGLDYMAPTIAQRLARDGEGEPIAWDFVDGDNRPYAPPGGPATALAHIVLAEGQATRLVSVRILSGPPAGVVPALQFVATTPARVVGLLPPQLTGHMPQDRLAEVAAQLPRCVIVVGARHLSHVPALRPNVLAVAAVAGPTPLPAPAGARADVAIPLTARDPGMIDSAVRSAAPPEDIAVARTLALAARIVTVKPELNGAGLKAQLLSYARPYPQPAHDAATHGWIADVARIHWLE